jgi:hypothetical protein
MTKRRVLPEIRVELSRPARGKRAVTLDYPEHLGLRTKLGGEPDWIQDFDVPACPQCDKDMTFVAQIDSIEHDSQLNPLRRPAVSKKDYMFGDVGMIYVFFCFNCLTTQSVFQCA